MLKGDPVSLGLSANEVQEEIKFPKRVSYLCPEGKYYQSQTLPWISASFLQICILGHQDSLEEVLILTAKLS